MYCLFIYIIFDLFSPDVFHRPQFENPWLTDKFKFCHIYSPSCFSLLYDYLFQLMQMFLFNSHFSQKILISALAGINSHTGVYVYDLKYSIQHTDQFYGVPFMVLFGGPVIPLNYTEETLLRKLKNTLSLKKESQV